MKTGQQLTSPTQAVKALSNDMLHQQQQREQR